MKSIQLLTFVKLWPKFLIEFKGSQPNLRIGEFRDSLHYALRRHKLNFSREVIELSGELVISIPDNTYPEIPLCAYVHLPDKDTCAEIASRCSLIRTIIEVWGDANDSHTVLTQSLKTYSNMKLLTPVAIDSVIQESWRVTFRRCGRSGNSGLSPAGKKELLEIYTPLLSQLAGTVDLQNATQDIIHLDDCHSFHKNTFNGANATETVGHCLLGRVVGNGLSIQNEFDLKHRPFLGTTSMKAVPAHITAVAALVGQGQLVLDPFCGTGSLLVAAAYLGANVVGSDVDGAGLGLVPAETPTGRVFVRGQEEDWKDRRRLWKNQYESKNANFTRTDGKDQQGKCTVDNFRHYQLQDRLTELIRCDVAMWLPGGLVDKDDLSASSIDSIRKYDKFDAIVADPPYGKRERARTSKTGAAAVDALAVEDEHAASDVMQTLLRVAAHRLRPGGRLVFWYPSEQGVLPEEVTGKLQVLLLLAQTGDSGSEGEDGPAPLRVLSVGKEELSTMWRWLCVLERCE